MSFRIFCRVLLCLMCSAAVFAAHDDKPKDGVDESIKSLTTAPGLKARLWADEKQLVNPVAITVDEKNRIYVAESFRFRIGGGIDNRATLFLFLDDMRAQATSDRMAVIEKYKDRFAPEYFTKFAERVSMLEDSSGKGRADKSTVYAGGFNHPLDGPAAGIVYRDGKIHLACIPKLYQLEDADGDGAAEKKDVLFDGFGVRFGISGHDLHGLIWGPDGKLYWSMGDRGFNVKTREGQQLLGLGTGGVFRCNPDGSELELYYKNLRNPQELAFDEFGNLFTVDNNADIGDKSRLTYILEGGTTGWHQGWQVLSYGKYTEYAGIGGHKPNPWLAEGLWKMRSDEQPAWVLPPIDHITNGPSGFAYYPGTGLPDSYKGMFFICDYTAGNNSGVHQFKVKEEGAGFKMEKPDKFVWGITCTDMVFGYDGRAYISDYLGGWHSEQRFKGRIIAVEHPEEIAKPAAAEVKKFFAEGFKSRTVPQLAELLNHADMRVRTAAQFEFAKRGKDGLGALREAAEKSKNLLGRLHGVWGLGQLGRELPEAQAALVKLLDSKEERVREQSAKMLGDLRCAQAGEALTKLLSDSKPRVKSLAAIAIGRIKHKAAFGQLVQILRENDDKDAFLRHSAVMGLAGTGESEALAGLARDSSKAVRLGVLQALRQLEDARVAAFLNDQDALVYAEAIRAIYDVPIVQAMPQLAAELPRHMEKAKAPGKMTQLLYSRIINAAFRYGKVEDAVALANFAAKSDAPEESRLEVLNLLQVWDKPTEVDPVMGVPRPVAERNLNSVREALKQPAAELLANAKDKMLAAAIRLAISYGFELDDNLLMNSLTNTEAAEDLRMEALKRYMFKKDQRLPQLLPKLLGDPRESIRIAALDALVQVDPKVGIPIATELLSGKVKAAGIYVVTDKEQKEWGGLKMGPPSKDDYADKNAKHDVTVVYEKTFTKPHKDAGATEAILPRLNDGDWAQNEDDIRRTTWFDGGEARIIMDLKKPIEISRINTYSWHVSNRAPQDFTLWGATGDTMPSASAKDLEKQWKKIAKIDTEPLKDGGMHGSAICSGEGSLGTFRYLLWQAPKRPGGTFFTELDVFEKGQSLPPLDPQDGPSFAVKQQALMSLARAPGAEAAQVITAYFDKLLAKQAPEALQLEILEAAKLRSEEPIKAKVAQYEKSLNPDNKVAFFSHTLQGGDTKRGREIFEFHAAACLRCHKLNNNGGDAGPSMSGVGKRLTREKLLESLVDPNAVVVPGFGVATLRMNDGTIVTGNITKEDDKELSVKLADGKVVQVKAAEIKKRIPPVSPMPPMDTVLKPREMRDLIQFLSTLQ
ncbi:MAG TPA: PVC-type heme-binding CxxCH protein [Planctomycetota bacterium]|nr:PVC-type heme-binding CxxCH protein [Planctomycetota bacterium]